MKKIGIVVLGLCLIACDSFEERIEEINSSPMFVLEGEAVGALTDSIKLGAGSYAFAIELVDAEANLSRIESEQSSGTGKLFVNGSEVLNGVIQVKESTGISYNAETSGKHDFVLTAFDDFDQKASLEVSFTAFSNLPPVAVVEVIDPIVGSEFERLIDASDSFDQDAKFGGRVVTYEYTFLGRTETISESDQTVIFPAPGTYQVLVRVQDDNDAWSELISIPVTI